LKRINLRYIDDAHVGVSFDELTSLDDVADVAEVLSGKRPEINRLVHNLPESIPPALRRTDRILTHPVFNRYHTETEMMRYLKRLENRDLSLVHAMIPLGSCTMKLNAAAELTPISWPRFAAMHPFAPNEQARGYAGMLRDKRCSPNPRRRRSANSGAQGEYAGLLAIGTTRARRGSRCA
jgi:glycine dehydrogenase